MSDAEFVFNDGRKAEKVEIDEGKTKITEIYVEPKPEKKLAQRIIEKYCVCEREIETIDEATGEVISVVKEKVSDGHVYESVNQTLETFEEKSPMQMVVEEKLNKKQFSVSNTVLVGIVLVQIAALAYIIFFM